jgi:hypothetical protein
VINIQKIITYLTAVVYSWIPSLLILWFLISRKVRSGLLAPILGFIFGSSFSIAAGYANSHLGQHIFPGHESPSFFFAVGVIEESVKFVASYAALFLIAKGRWKDEFQKNWLAQSISGSLGFSAAENFVYGIDGQGGIARVIPLIAHTFFAVFWGFGFYKFTLIKSGASKEGFSFPFLRKLPSGIWLLIGMIEGVVLHGLYDCVVSESVVPNKAKPLLWLLLGIVVYLLVSWHHRQVTKLRSELPNQIDSNTFPEKPDSPKPINAFLYFLGFGIPGFTHIFARKEFVTGFSFLGLSFLMPYLFARIALSQLAGKLLTAGHSNHKFTGVVFMVLLGVVLLYVLVAAWALWELKASSGNSSDAFPQTLTQASNPVAAANHYPKPEGKRRLAAILPVTTLFFVSLGMSLFLPVFDRVKANSKGQDEKMVIKEIPLGITWEVEQSAPAAQKEKVLENSLTNTSDSLSLRQNDDTMPNQVKDKNKQSSSDKPPSGVPNSDSTNRTNLPKTLPKTGFIGVQLGELIINGETKSFIASVYPNTSAERAGIKVGDLILSVNGKNVSGLNAFQVSALIKGQLGTEVTLKVMRHGEGEVTLRAYRTGNLFNDNDLLNPFGEK